MHFVILGLLLSIARAIVEQARVIAQIIVYHRLRYHPRHKQPIIQALDINRPVSRELLEQYGGL